MRRYITTTSHNQGHVRCHCLALFPRAHLSIALTVGVIGYDLREALWLDAAHTPHHAGDEVAVQPSQPTDRTVGSRDGTTRSETSSEVIGISHQRAELGT